MELFNLIYQSRKGGILEIHRWSWMNGKPVESVNKKIKEFGNLEKTRLTQATTGWLTLVYLCPLEKHRKPEEDNQNAERNLKSSAL